MWHVENKRNNQEEIILYENKIIKCIFIIKTRVLDLDIPQRLH